MAKMTLPEFVAELNARGFDGFQDGDLVRYINFGYLTVGRLTKWAWEEGDVTASLTPGQYRLTLATDLPTVKSVKAVLGTTLNYETRLTAMSDDEFYNNWVANDLANVRTRGEPYKYYLTGQHLYILPPPLYARTFTIRAEQFLAELSTGVNEVLITPAEYDEAILHAAEEHCHIRARQPQFADVSRKKLQDFFDDALADETTRMADRVERVIAGRQCL